MGRHTRTVSSELQCDFQKVLIALIILPSLKL